MPATLTDSRIIAEYRRRTPKSAALAAAACDVLPSGITHDSRYLRPYPIYVSHATGSRKWDVDGNEYVDYSGGHGAMLLGHNHPQIVAAVAEQLAKGTHYGSSHELEVRWAEQVRRLMPALELVRFTSSGTEATLLALRLARAFTGRQKVLRFAGHFHGWHDHMAFGVSSHFDGKPSAGVLPEVARAVVLAPPGDFVAFNRLLDENKDVAAVIIEPTGASWGQLPVLADFLYKLRQETARRDIVLIFDEVITGFRVGPGGAQEHFGIRPDLTTLAKILAGGLPGGAIGGRRDIMELLAYPEPGVNREKIPHHGTYNANPLSAAAGLTALKLVGETDVCQRANDYAARLREALNEVIRERRLPWAVYGTFSGFHIWPNPQRLPLTTTDIEEGRYDYRVLKARPRPELLTKLRLGMLVHGVEIFSWPGGPTSAAHSDEDLERTVAAFRATLDMLRDEGEIA